MLDTGAAIGTASASGIRWALFVGGLFALCAAVVALRIPNIRETAGGPNDDAPPGEIHAAAPSPQPASTESR